MQKKGNQSYTTLKNIESIGIKSENDHKIPTVIFTSVLVMFTVLCLTKLFFNSFHVFGNKTIGPDPGFFTSEEIALFFVKVMIGCVPICIVNGLKRYSLLCSACTFVAYALYFLYNYKSVSNGFVFALNKAILNIVTIKGSTPDVYYLTAYSITNPEQETMLFCYAAAFSICFILAFSTVQFALPLLFTACVSAVAVLPLVFRTLEDEEYLAGALLCCILVYVLSVQGYRNIWTGRLVQGYGQTVRIHGSYVSYSSFQQAAAAFLCIVVVCAVSNLFVNYTSYQKSPKTEALAHGVVNGLNHLTNGSFGGSTSNTLSKGDLSKSGNIRYNGEVMFDIKYNEVPRQSSYLRSYTASVYDSNRWSDFDKSVYNSYTDMWNNFDNDNFYANTMYGDFISEYGYFASDFNTVTIRHNKLSKKTFLSDSRLSSDSPILKKVHSDYDEYPNFSFFLGTGKEYEQNFAEINKNDLVFISGNSDGKVHDFYTSMHDGEFYLAGLDKDVFGMSSVGTASRDFENYFLNEKIYRQFVMENYLRYPDNITDYVPKRFASIENDFLYEYYGNTENDLSYSPYNYYQYVISEVQQYLANHAEYSLSPGDLPSGRDFTEYFINESQKGYCVHFATAGVLMLRYAGIPARYAEGFYVGENDVNYSESDGFSHIPDSNAHAWAEVYYPLIGWQAVEFTPPYNNGNVPYENYEYNNLLSDTDNDESSETETDTQSDTQTNTETDSSSDTNTENHTDKDGNNIIDSQSDNADDSEVETDKDGLIDKVFNKDDGEEGLKLIYLILIGLGYAIYYILKLVLWLVLRWLCMKLREKRFTEENTRTSVRALYRYSLFLLRVAWIKAESNESDEEFARRAMKKIDSSFTAEYLEFTQHALHSRFGKDPLSREDVDKMIAFINKLTQKIYDDSGKIKKFVIKYLLFLI